MEQVVSRFRRMKAKEDEKDAVTVVTGERDALLRTLKEVQARNRWLEKRVASTADAAVVEGGLKHYCHTKACYELQCALKLRVYFGRYRNSARCCHQPVPAQCS
jgi:hypothetical protein